MTGQDRPDPGDDVMRLVVEARRRWEGMPPVEVRMSRSDAFLLLSGLQVLTRAEGLSGPARHVYTVIGRALQELVCDDPELYAMAETGWKAPPGG